MIPKATCYDLVARFFEQSSALQHVETDRAGDDGDAEGWVFALWRLHTNQLDRPVETVHARSEIFLLNVHLDACEWERILEKLIGSPCLERLILTMCWMPHSCAGTLARVFTSCPHLSMGPLGGAMVDASWAGDDKLEFGWVDTMWNVTDSWGFVGLTVPFFVSFVVFVGFYLVNVALAVIWVEYDRTLQDVLVLDVVREHAAGLGAVLGIIQVSN